MSEKNATGSQDAAVLAQAFPQLDGAGSDAGGQPRAGTAGHLQAVPSPAGKPGEAKVPVPVSGSAPMQKLSWFGDIPVTLVFEVGRQDVTVQQLMTLNRGSILQLQDVFVDSIDVKVGDRKIASAEAVSLKKRVGVRISEIAVPSDLESR